MTTTSDAPMTIVDDGRETRVPARIDGARVMVHAQAVTEALGWNIGSALDAVDLTTLASRLRRPLAIDVPERVAWLGVSAADRAAALTGPHAPDFTLPDLDGRLHSLSEHRGSKVFLVAYASW
jgi:hypothetical protein